MEREELETKFVQMVQQHSQIIYKVASFYVDPSQTLDDLYQETVLNLWKAFPNFREESTVSTWVYRIALNTCVSFFRRRKNKPVYIGLQDEIEYKQEDKELINELYITINRLGKLERALILLYLDDKSYKEISDITGFTVTNVATKLNRIKKKLKELSNL
jgi:RNA polymerase sigma-70 factor (ECF subfamily)